MAYIPDQSKGMTQAMKDELMRTLSGFAGMATSSVAEPIAGLNALLRGRPELVEQTRNALTYGNPADIMPRNFRLPEAVNTGIGYFNESADRLGAISPVAGAALKTAPAFVGAMLPSASRKAFSSVGGDISRALANPSFRTGANAQRGMIGGAAANTGTKLAMDVTRKDASSIFGDGSERIRYTHPQTGGTIEILKKPDGSASVLELLVPEEYRGQGIGQQLQSIVMQDFPEMGGQVSSKAAAKTAYRLGRRPPGKQGATLDDVFAEIDDMSSVNMVSPAMQQRFNAMTGGK